MKTAPTGLVTLLGTGQFVFCDLYQFTLATGQVLRYTTSDVDITYAGNTYSSALFFDQCRLMMPRNLWQAACRWTLFDAGCTLSQAAFAKTGTAQVGSTQSQIVTTGLAQPSGYFALGQVTMTSGLNSGFRRMVKSFDGVILSLIAPFPFTVAVGDSFTAYPGCNKSIADCTNKFNNFVNFGGEDLVPRPETAV